MKMDYKLMRFRSMSVLYVSGHMKTILMTSQDVTTEWIQFTNEMCAVWCHVDCLDTSDGDYVCTIQAIFS